LRSQRVQSTSKKIGGHADAGASSDKSAPIGMSNQVIHKGLKPVVVRRRSHERRKISRKDAKAQSLRHILCQPQRPQDPNDILSVIVFSLRLCVFA
jgi:hypothetical protein